MELLKYKKGDETKILELFELAFNKKLSKQFWDWRFKNNPFGDDLMINLMWEDGVMAGHYAVSAIELNIDGKIVPSSLSGTTMTHPSFQGRGIFSELALKLYQRIHEDHSIGLVYGFPNNNSHYGLVKKIHWNDVAVMANFQCEVSEIAKNKISTGFEITKIETFIAEHENFIKNTIKELGFTISVNRSCTYLNWRYINCPINTYECFKISDNGILKAIIIFKEYQPDNSTKQIDIVDFFCAPDLEIIRSSLNLVSQYLLKKGIDNVTFNTWISLFDPRHLLMERLSFVIDNPLTYMCAKPFSPKYKNITEFKKWYVSMGDSDVY